MLRNESVNINDDDDVDYIPDTTGTQEHEESVKSSLSDVFYEQTNYDHSKKQVFAEHLSSQEHRQKKEQFEEYKKYYFQNVKTGLGTVNRFISDYQLDSINMTEIYGEDDIRINKLVTLFKDCKKNLSEAVQSKNWIIQHLSSDVCNLTLLMKELNRSVTEAFYRRNEPKQINDENDLDLQYESDKRKKKNKSKLKGKSKWRKIEAPIP